MKDNFLVHAKYVSLMEDLTDTEFRQIVTAMSAFTAEGIEPEFEDRALRIIWKSVRDRLQADIDAYEEKCRQNRQNGEKGGRPKNRAVSGETQENRTVSKKTEGFLEKPKKPDTDTDIDTESDNKRESTREKSAGMDESAGTDAKDKSGIPFAEIVAYLNNKAGTSFPDSKDTRRHIRARWEEGFRLEDFKAVIDKKVDEWRTDAKMAPFIRPLTLFSTKFESYLNQPRTKVLGFEQRETDYFELEKRLDKQFAGM